MRSKDRSRYAAFKVFLPWLRSTAAVDDACAAAIEVEVYDYRFVRRYLERKAPAPLTLRQVDPLIRQLSLYRDVIEQRIQAQSPSPSNQPCSSKEDDPE